MERVLRAVPGLEEIVGGGRRRESFRTKTTETWFYPTKTELHGDMMRSPILGHLTQIIEWSLGQESGTSAVIPANCTVHSIDYTHNAGF